MKTFKTFKNLKTSSSLLLTAGAVMLILVAILLYLLGGFNIFSTGDSEREKELVSQANEKLGTDFKNLQELNEGLGTDFKSAEQIEIADEAPDTGLDISEFDEEFVEESEKSSKVYEMTLDLPVDTDNFSLYYYYEGDSFQLYINPNNRAEGRQELDNFLDNYDIEDVSWIHNLTEVDTRPTPEPE